MSIQQTCIRSTALVTPTQVTVITVSGAGSTTVPAGCSHYVGEAIGGGGAGFGASFAAQRAGGGGGQYAISNSMIVVTPGSTIYYFAGAGNPSSDSWVNTSNVAPTSATTGALAKCGGTAALAAPGFGNVAGSVGFIINIGGNGTGTASAVGGGGGGASGQAFNQPGGADTTGLSPATPMGDGNGGNGGSGGTAPGGGGGGSNIVGPVAGGIGRVRLLFYP